VVAFTAIRDEVHSAREPHLMHGEKSGVRLCEGTGGAPSVSSHIRIVGENGIDRFVTARSSPPAHPDDPAVCDDVVAEIKIIAIGFHGPYAADARAVNEAVAHGIPMARPALRAPEDHGIPDVVKDVVFQPETVPVRNHSDVKRHGLVVPDEYALLHEKVIEVLASAPDRIRAPHLRRALVVEVQSAREP